MVWAFLITINTRKGFILHNSLENNSPTCVYAFTIFKYDYRFLQFIYIMWGKCLRHGTNSFTPNVNVSFNVWFQTILEKTKPLTNVQKNEQTKDKDLELSQISTRTRSVVYSFIKNNFQISGNIKLWVRRTSLNIFFPKHCLSFVGIIKR